MPLDPLARLARKGDVERLESRIQGSAERRREIGKGVDARRERVPRTVQAPLLLVVPAGRPGSAPGVVVRDTAP
jgi:hypothetical protein